MSGFFFNKRQRLCGEHRCGESRKNRGCFHPLSDFEQGAKGRVLSNNDRKTIEMGLFNGAIVTVIKNHLNDVNMVVAVGESRYIISKEVAKKINVR